MICPKCGCNVKDDDLFCSNCGTKLKSKEHENVEHEDTEYENPEHKNTFQDSIHRKNLPEKSPARKRSGKKILAAGLVVVITGVAVLAGTHVINFNDSKENAYVFSSDGDYKLLTDLKKENTIKFASGFEDDYNNYGYVKFSPDGKYVYFFSEYDIDNSVGTLCRAEWKKLRRNSDKNEKYIEVVSNNVSMYFKFVKDNGIIYLNGADDLYYYNGQESVRIAKSVMDYVTDGDERVVYTVSNKDYTDDGNSTYRLYGVSLSAPEEKNKLASDVLYVVEAEDFDNIIYEKWDSDSQSDLYVVGFDKEKECLGKEISKVYDKDGEIYYTVENGDTASLYDFVDDPEKDNKEKEKEEPSKSYEPLDWYCYEEDYDEIYTSCSQTCSFFEDEENASIESQSAEEFQTFVKKYKKLENKQGYFLITDEIKNDLMNLADTYGEGYSDEWLGFCFAVGTGDNSDEEEDQKADTEYIREQLKDSANAYPLGDLCLYKDGKVTTISKDVIAVKNYANCFSYATKDMITKKIKLEDVSDISDVENLFQVTLGEQSCLVPYNMNESAVTLSKASGEYLKKIEDESWIYVYMAGKNVYVLTDEGVLATAAVKDSTAGEFTKIADHAAYLGKYNENYYYGVKNEDGSVYDLYSCVNGKSTLKAEEIELDSFAVYEDGMILTETANTNDTAYELVMIADKKEIIIAEDVSDYVRVDDKHILYISDHDLYVYDGDKRELLGVDADYFWTKDKIDSNLDVGDELC